MTEIIIFKTSKGLFKGFECNGHAGFADYGKDVVCAAVSVLTINTINSIDQLTGDQIAVSEDGNAGIISCHFKNDISEKTDLLLQSFELGVNSIYKQYGKKYLNIKIKEV